MSAWSLLAWASFALSLVAVFFCGYLGLLALLAWRIRPPTYGEPTLRFDVIVPAHNEETGIASTVHSLLAIDYPKELFAVVVVADNCQDATARLAREAGAVVIERQHDTLKGKGYALELAFERRLAEGQADGFVVVDADTEVSANLLHAFAHRLQAGAGAVQAEYGVSNVHASWRTRLMTLALTLIHVVRSLARERLGLSAGLRGNGMCFARQTLVDHPHKAYGLVEDVEYGVHLALHGIRVFFAWEACVRGEMVSGGQAAESQRRRWEGGRGALLRQKLPEVVKAALARGDKVLADIAMDLLVPPLSNLGALLAVGLVAEAALLLWSRGVPGPGLVTWGLALAGLLAYLGRGLWLSRLGWRGVQALLWAPVYVVWKLVLVRPWRGQKDAWVRTRREAEEQGGEDG